LVLDTNRKSIAKRAPVHPHKARGHPTPKPMHDDFWSSMFTRGTIYLDVVIYFCPLGISSKGLVPQRPKETCLLFAPFLGSNISPF